MSACTPPIRRVGILGASCLVLAAGAACSGGEAVGEPVEFVVPPGASFSQVVDSLDRADIVGRPDLFRFYARVTGADRRVRAGRYAIAPGTPWDGILEALTEGRIVPRALTIPEGWTLRQMAPRIAAFTGAPEAAVDSLLRSDDLAVALGVPGPTLEGYLFPDTYLLAEGSPPAAVVAAMADAYREYWTPERRARLDSLEMSEREVVTLASIVQAEAGNTREMPTIAGVYLNRLRDGWLLQADPTVLYALGGPRDRLLFSAIDSVAENPYNTYRQPGLPPGPIAAPGAAALDAALYPEEHSYMYFVAGPDRGHIFSVTLAEHNRAVADYRRRRAQGRGEG